MPLFRRRPKTSGLVGSAAGQQIGDRKQSEKARRLRQAWQQDAWTYFDAIGEIRYPLEFMANAVTRMRIIPSIIEDPDEAPVPLTEATGVPDSLITAAAEDLATLGRGQLGLRPLLHDQYINNKVAGEMWLVGDVDPDTEQERWRIRSIDEVIIRDNGIWVRDDPTMQSMEDWTHLQPDTSYVVRLWRPHPRFEALATSPMHAILGSCEELLLLSRSIRAMARSRLAGNGLLILAKELTLPGIDPTNQDPEANPFFDELAKAMLTPINDEGDASAVVPLVAQVPGEYIKEGKASEHIRFDRPFDEIAMKLREELIGRIATGLDLPKEVVTGVVDLNHWTAWQVDDNTFRHHIEPDVITQVDDLTSAYSRPMLAARNAWAPELINRFVLWYDPVELVTHPDQSKNVETAFTGGAAGRASLRKHLGLGDEDKPDQLDEVLYALQHLRGVDPSIAVPILTAVAPNITWPDPASLKPGGGAAAPITAPAPRDGTAEPVQPGPPGEPQAGEGEPTPDDVRPPARTAAGTPVPTSDADRVPDGVMIAFYPTSEQAAQLAMDGGEAADTIHVTLAYLGHVVDLTDDQQAQIHTIVEQAASTCAPLDGEFGGIGRFTADGSPDGDPVFAQVDVPGLASFRDALCQELAAAGLPLPSEHGYTPHATLAYVDADADMPAHRLDPVPASFAAMSAVIGPDRTDYPLTGSDTPMVAAAPRIVHERLSRQLLDIDRQLRTRLLTACDAAVRRQLERAGARLRSKAAKDPVLRASLAAVPQHLVASTLGHAKVLTLGVTEADLVDSDWGTLAGQWDSWVQRAQAQARKIAAQITGVPIDDLSVDALAASQDAARADGWTTLADALGTLTMARIYDPRPDAPPVGEHDPDLTVPPSLVRDAVAVAGGYSDDGQASIDLPASAFGVGNGGDVIDFILANDVERDHYVWHHGDVARPLDEHLGLDGYEFASWDDPALTVTGTFPEVDQMAPGDHDGCSCDAEIVWAAPAVEAPVAAAGNQ